MQNIDIIYEDEDIILCRKPAGVATQTKRLGQQDVESLLKNYRAKKKEPPYIGVVHRLDQPVEGLMVFAKNPKAAASLSKQIQQKIIGKHYYAVSACSPKEKQGRLEDYLLTDKKNNITTVVEMPQGLNGCGVQKGNGDVPQAHLPKEAKKAVLEYKVIKEKHGYTLFDIHLHTGRQHQIRVQMAHMGCPLVGDNKYGNAFPRERTHVENENCGLGLCSYRISIRHPRTDRIMDWAIQPRGTLFAGWFQE